MFPRSVVSLCALALVTTAFSCRAASRILLNGLGPTQATLYISNADGSRERILQQSGSLDYYPSWSRFDGANVKQLTDDQREEGTPAWQPHRSAVATAIAPSQ